MSLINRKKKKSVANASTAPATPTMDTAANTQGQDTSAGNITGDAGPGFEEPDESGIVDELGNARQGVAPLSARESILLSALLQGFSTAEAAKVAHVSERTAFRWKASEHFQAALSTAKSELLDSAITCLHSHAVAFASTLRKVADDEKCRGHERVSASREGLSLLFRGLELFSMEARIRKLEQQSAGTPDGIGNQDDIDHRESEQ